MNLTQIVPDSGLNKLDARLEAAYGDGLNTEQVWTLCSPDADPDDRAGLLEDLRDRMRINIDDIYEV